LWTKIGMFNQNVYVLIHLSVIDLRSKLNIDFILSIKFDKIRHLYSTPARQFYDGSSSIYNNFNILIVICTYGSVHRSDAQEVDKEMFTEIKIQVPNIPKIKVNRN
jgi:hypothetical protein